MSSEPDNLDPEVKKVWDFLTIKERIAFLHQNEFTLACLAKLLCLSDDVESREV